MGNLQKIIESALETHDVVCVMFAEETYKIGDAVAEFHDFFYPHDWVGDETLLDYTNGDGIVDYHALAENCFHPTRDASVWYDEETGRFVCHESVGGALGIEIKNARQAREIATGLRINYFGEPYLIAGYDPQADGYDGVANNVVVKDAVVIAVL